MMCKKENEVWRVLLLDSDWSGKDGKVRYPGNINQMAIDRPAGVQGAELIVKEHDRAMIKLLFWG